MCKQTGRAQKSEYINKEASEEGNCVQRDK
jgi:hypothetical protein